MEIREIKNIDVKKVSFLIKKTSKESNFKDYPVNVLDSLCEHYSSQNIFKMMKSRKIFVASEDNKIIGTAGIKENEVIGVFVDPAYQGLDVGLKLMQFIEQIAVKKNYKNLKVISSLTAENFYKKLGYVSKEKFNRGKLGVNIKMSKKL